MRDDERRKLENQLMVMGLAGLDDPELVIQMAKIINAHPGFSDPHAFYLGMLNGCPVVKRREMYDALLPHLKFKVWPLDTYERLLKEHAANVESYYAPVHVGEEPIKFAGQEFEQVRAKDAAAVLVKVSCSKCTSEAQFYGETVVTAIQVARLDGWKRDLLNQKEICPKCAGEEAPRGFFEARTPEDDARVQRAAAKRKQRADRMRRAIASARVN